MTVEAAYASNAGSVDLARRGPWLFHKASFLPNTLSFETCYAASTALLGIPSAAIKCIFVFWLKSFRSSQLA